MDQSADYLAHQDTITEAIRAVCRRHRLRPEDAEEFSAHFHLRLVQDQFGLLRKFEGRSSLRTYLFVVVARAFQDWRNSRWGKWRPSVEAKRLGDVAQHLETLVVRDGLTLDEAHEVLRTRFGDGIRREELDGMMARFPVRAPRTFVTADVLESRPADGAGPDGHLQQRERDGAARVVLEALRNVLAQLDSEDRLILRLHFDENATIADIARMLHLDQKTLYRRRERMLQNLRGALEAKGIAQAHMANFDVPSAFGLSELPGRPGES